MSELLPKYENSYALILGISDYKKAIGFSNLKNSINDAKAVENIVKEKYGFSNDKTFTLYDEKATKEAILKKFIRLFKCANNINDRVFVFIAGHGYRETDYPDIGFLVPTDGDYNDPVSLIRWDEIINLKSYTNAKHVFFIIDACYSGTATKKRSSFSSDKKISELMKRESFQILASGKSDQMVDDSSFNRQNHSVFTDLLLDVFENKIDIIGPVTANNIFSYINDQLSIDPSNNQVPDFQRLHGDGDFIFNPPCFDDSSSKNKSDKKIQDVYDQFIFWCQKNRSEATFTHYQSRLRPFVKKFGDRTFESISDAELEDYLEEASIRADGSLLAPDTIRGNAIAYKQLERFAIDNKWLEKPVIDKIKRPLGRKRERLITPEETQSILDNSPPEFAIVFKALRQSGAKPGELCQIEIDDINWDLKKVKITDKKTGRSRNLVIGEKLEELLKEAIEDRKEGPVFLNSKGDQWTSQKLGSMFARIRKKANLPKELCLSLVRHEHATELCKIKGIRATQLSLGHSSVTSTLRYDQIDEDDVRNNQDLL